jgi:hypothetical protein
MAVETERVGKADAQTMSPLCSLDKSAEGLGQSAFALQVGQAVGPGWTKLDAEPGGTRS